MRPDPNLHLPDSDAHRIISLGEVRRRRAARRRVPDRPILVALGLVGLTAFVLWLIVFFTVPPARLLTYLAFFIPLFLATASSGALISYGLEWRSGLQPEVRAALRRGILAGSILVINLAALAAHRWLFPVLAVTVMGAVVIEVADGMRRH